MRALLAAELRATPEDMRGRVDGAVTQAAVGLAALAPLTSGLLVEHVSGQWSMAAFAAAMGIAAITSLALPGIRNAGTPAASS